MEDLIKRSDAIGAFVEETNGVNVEKAIKVVDTYLQIRECDEVWDSIRAIRDCLECAKDEIADYIPSADRPQEWIPCSERLPEDPNPRFIYASKTYQVTTASGEVVALKWQKTEVRGKTVMRWEWSSGVIYHGDALAWKPLSEPWKGADDELV